MKFSIITPNYNQEKYIRHTLSSIVDQRVEVNLEIIVVDGASTDGSLSEIEPFREHIDVLISEKDEGQAHAINKGIQQATGDWIGYLNSDDLFFTGSLLKVKQLIDAHPDVRWISGCVKKFNDQGHVYDIGKPHLPKHSGVEWVTYEANCPQMATFVHRSVIEQIGLFDQAFHFSFDTEFWMRAWLHGFRPLLSEEILAGFRIHDTSKTMTSRPLFLQDHRAMLHKHKAHFTEKEIVSAELVLDKLLAVYKCYASNQAKQPLKELFQAMRLSPMVMKERFFWGALKHAITR